MAFIADFLLFAGALGVALYCWVLSRRLRALSDLDKGVGGAVAVLSVQVDDLSKALARTEAASQHAAERLEAEIERADEMARRLELLIASLHDLPEEEQSTRSIDPFFVRKTSRMERGL